MRGFLLSGSLTMENYLIGKSSTKGPFSIAMLDWYGSFDPWSVGGYCTSFHSHGGKQQMFETLPVIAGHFAPCTFQ